MVKELIFHLGNRKTGSTSIQDMLAQNAIVCADKTLFYPTKTNHISLAKTLGVNHSPAQRAERFTKLARRLGKSDADIGVISAEYFESVDPHILKATLDEFLPEYRDNTRLIAYVRPHAERFLSNYAEQIKLGQFYGSLEKFLEKMQKAGVLEYTPKFEAWRDVFGDRFELRPFIRDWLAHKDVVHDFIGYALGDVDFTLPKTEPSNSSLSLEYLALIREFQRVLRQKKNLKQLQVALGKQLGRSLAQFPRHRHTRLALHTDIVEALIDSYHEDAISLDAAFFPEVRPMETALLSAREAAIPAPQSLQAEDILPQHEVQMVHVWATLIRSMTGQMAEELCSNLQRHLAQELQQVARINKPKKKKPARAAKNKRPA